MGVYSLRGIPASLLSAIVWTVGLQPTWASNSAADHCFLLRNWTGTWKATPDGRALYIRLSSKEVYRLDLDGAHRILNSPFAILYDRNTASAICDPLDFQLTASDRSGVAEHLIVRKMVSLTPEQVKALPQGLVP